MMIGKWVSGFAYYANHAARWLNLEEQLLSIVVLFPVYHNIRDFHDFWKADAIDNIIC